MMGSGIAYAAASCGIDVVLKDVDRPLRLEGHAEKVLAPDRDGRRLGRRDCVLARIGRLRARTTWPAAVDHRGGAGSRAVEAVIREAKRRSTGAIVASNTDLRPELGRTRKPPRGSSGLISSPVDWMPLVEIIAAARLPKRPWRGVRFRARARATLIIVNDGRGFYRRARSPPT
jgi:3-hydroxyacyl-CoA dehydrogenase/enoyl-CoA hydratase/3-hydroxybutyryl-CoA epimerase